MNETFLAERASCVGSSDLADLIQMPPYGCTRKLWYDKARVPADFPFAGNSDTERGTNLESFALLDFSKEYPHLWLTKPEFRRLSEDGHPMVGCHADALVSYTCGGKPFAVNEVKCPSARVFYQGRGAMDPPNEAKLQAVYCAGIWGVGDCFVQWFSGDAWRSRVWSFQFDPPMFADLVTAAANFWDTLDKPVSPYERLPDGDPRCDRCPWRTQCKGIDAPAVPMMEADGRTPLQLAADPDHINRLALDFVATRKRLKDAEEAHAIVKQELIGLFPASGYVDVPAGRVSFSESFRKGYTRTVKPTTAKLLRVKPAQLEDDDDERDITTD